MRTADGDVVVGTPDAKAEEDEDESNSNTEEEEDDDDESEEGSSGSGSDLDLALAEDGRVACPLLPHLPLDAFRAFPDKFALKKRRRRFAARVARRLPRGVHGSRGDEARRPIQRRRDVLARRGRRAEVRAGTTRQARVRSAHAEGGGAAAEEPGVFKNAGAAAGFDPRRSGAEWWTQVVDVDDEIGMHWDKDYALEAADVNVHPHIGTVTYFSWRARRVSRANERRRFSGKASPAHEDFETDRDAAFRRVKPRHSNANAFLSFPRSANTSRSTGGGCTARSPSSVKKTKGLRRRAKRRARTTREARRKKKTSDASG